MITLFWLLNPVCGSIESAALGYNYDAARQSGTTGRSPSDMVIIT